MGLFNLQHPTVDWLALEPPVGIIWRREQKFSPQGPKSKESLAKRGLWSLHIVRVIRCPS